MSVSRHEQADEQKVELGTSVNWPPIFAAVGLGLLVVVAVIVLHLLPGTSAAPALLQNMQVSVEEQEIISPTPSKMRPHWRQTPTQATTAETFSTSTPLPTPKPKRPIVAVRPVPKPATPVVEVRAPTPTEPPPVPQPTFKRHQPYSADELFARLQADSRELDIEAGQGKGTTAQLLDEPKKEKPKKASPTILELVGQRDDLKGLPMRNVADCQAPAEETTLMKEISFGTRLLSARKELGERLYNDQGQHTRDMVACVPQIAKKSHGSEDVGVRMLVQIFQAEDHLVRLQVVKTLASIKAKSAGAALVRFAVFDLNPEIREKAVQALKDRSSADYRPILLEALRYPWAPVADHAAEALAALDDREAVGDLVNLLDKSDPLTATQNKAQKWVAPELVRVNHLGSCVLCHAPSSAKDFDTLRVAVPKRGQPLPVPYCDVGPAGFIRADVTYLKQDFSVMQVVKNPGAWPAAQRFDYLIRHRELSAKEVSCLEKAKEPETSSLQSYPQREAVLWALRELTGYDAGSRSEGWRRYLMDERD